MRSIVILVALLLCALGSAGRADAGQPCAFDENGDFNDPKKGTEIATCTAVIQSGSASSRDRALAYVHRGLAYREKRDYQRTLSDFSHAIDLNPDPSTFAFRAKLYRSLKDYQHAIADYDHAIALDLELLARRPDARDFLLPMEAYHRGSRASIYLLQGDTDRAIAEFDEVISKIPEASVAVAPRPYIYRGIAHADKRNYNRAIADFDAALADDARSAEALYARGLVKKKMGDSASGNADIADARRLDRGIAENEWAVFWKHLEN